MPEKSEKEIENEILAYLWSVRIFAWKNQSIGVYDPKRQIFRKSRNPFHIKGVSDIIGVYRGKMLAIEVKSKKGRISPEQVDFLKKVINSGSIAFVARSVEDVKRELEKISA